MPYLGAKMKRALRWSVCEICIAQQGLEYIGSDGSYLACRLRQPSSGISLLDSCCKLCAPPFKDQGDMTCQLSLHHRCPVYGLKTRRDVGWPYRGQGSDSQAGDVLALFLVKEKIRSCGALYLPDSASQTFQTKLNIFSKVQGPLDSWGRATHDDTNFLIHFLGSNPGATTQG